MRVISGKYKGRILSAPRGEVRPTTDLVKGSLFSVLTSKGLIDGARCLDIFCGTGGLGIEALSRGAESCVFVDKNIDNVKKNIDKIGVENVTLIQRDFRSALKILKDEKFDLIFCDPPYKSGYCEMTVKEVFSTGMLNIGGAIIIEHSSENDLINLPDNCIIDRRVFGISAIEIIIRGGDDESDICGDV
ncbi:MAG: 16S rRNA (guanine(966)-N(2))-methyltransferase RsmD [Clostridiales bacterium]|nr:16S rRNA (guanine(966)-N(2))-methyltransferase RsmD [Clostridiales bacterium]